MKIYLSPLFILWGLLIGTTPVIASEVTVASSGTPMLRFALGKLEEAIQLHGDSMTTLSPDGNAVQPSIVVSVSDQDGTKSVFGDN